LFNFWPSLNGGGFLCGKIRKLYVINKKTMPDIIKKKKITVPSSMDEITLRRYQRFVKETIDTENISEEFIASRICDIFLDIETTEVMRMTMGTMLRVSTKIAEVLNQKPELIPIFKMGDTEFGFIPKLEDMTFGEYVDLDSFVSDWSTMHKAMAVLFRPIETRYKDKYKIQEYKGDLFHEAMKDMPLSVAMGSLLFFYRLENDLLRTLTGYSQETENQVDLVRSGVGILAYTPLPKATSQDTTE